MTLKLLESILIFAAIPVLAWCALWVGGVAGDTGSQILIHIGWKDGFIHGAGFSREWQMALVAMFFAGVLVGFIICGALCGIVDLTGGSRDSKS